MFDSFDLLGFETMEQFTSQAWMRDPGFAQRSVRREMTPDMAIVSFPETPKAPSRPSTTRH